MLLFFLILKTFALIIHAGHHAVKSCKILFTDTD